MTDMESAPTPDATPDATPEAESVTPPVTPPAAGEAAESTPEAEKKPAPGIVRWWMIAVILVFGLLFELVLGGPVLKIVTQSAGASAVGGEVAIDGATLSLLGAKAGYEGLEATRENKRLLGFKKAALDIEMTALLRGSVVVEKAVVEQPTLIVRRTAADLATEEELKEAEESGAEPGKGLSKEEILKRLAEEDFLETCLERLREARKRLKQLKALRERHSGETPLGPDGKPLNPDDVPDYEPRAAHLLPQVPAFWIREATCEGLEIGFEDEAGGAAPLKLVGARATIENLSSEPWLVDKPFVIELKGRLDGSEEATVFLRLSHDFQKDASTLTLSFVGLPMERIDPYLAATVPLRFRQGTLLDLELEAKIDAFELHATPRITLRKIDCEVRDPNRKTIAGLDSKRLARELSELDQIVLADITVTGPVDDPKVDFGSTLKQLVLQGAKQFAQKKLDEARAKGEQAAREQLDKGKKALDEKTAETSKKLSDKAAKEAEDLKKKAADKLKGWFGGKKDKDQD